jgi:hypothetical protein
MQFEGKGRTPMMEMTNIINIPAAAAIRAGHIERSGAAGCKRGFNEEYYRTYYRLLVATHANTDNGRRRLKSIKMQRRKARRET